MTVDLMDAYSTFKVMQLYFSGNYDIVKYGYRCKRFNGDQLFKDKTEYVFRKLANKFHDDNEMRIVYAANLVRNPKLFPTNINEDVAIILKKYNKNKVALLEDLKKLIVDDDLLTTVKNGDIISNIYSGIVGIEIITYLNRFIPIVKLIDDKHKNDFAWNLVKPRIEKLTPYCGLNNTEERDYIKSQLLSCITETQTENN